MERARGERVGAARLSALAFGRVEAVVDIELGDAPDQETEEHRGAPVGSDVSFRPVNDSTCDCKAGSMVVCPPCGLR